MGRKTTHICFKVPRRVKEILEILADYWDMNISNIFQAYALQLVIQFYPRIVEDEDVKKFIEKVFGSEEDNVPVPKKPKS